MKKYFSMILTAIICLGFIVMGIISGFTFSELQLKTLKTLGIICGASALYCFIVGEITGNTSQMDKLWSILPICYIWVIAIKGGLSLRLLLFSVIVTLWGVRLTYNFGRKGAYSIKFWGGREDYRWEYLRNTRYFKNKIVWAIFNLLFISIYQNLIVLLITLPAVAVMESTVAFGVIDAVVSVVALLFLILETVADEYQWKFHQTKKKLLSGNKSLSEIDYPYNLGFNTTGIWGYMRHPNYLGEQGIWFTLYFFCLGAKVTSYGIFNWSILGSALLILLFLGSSTLGESITLSKYPKFSEYQKQVYKYLPIRKFKVK